MGVVAQPGWAVSASASAGGCGGGLAAPRLDIYYSYQQHNPLRLVIIFLILGIQYLSGDVT